MASNREVLAFEYAVALSQVVHQQWEVQYESYTVGNLSHAEALVLIHPIWYREHGSDRNSCSVRGRPTFSIILPSNGTKCQSNDLWGYECPFQNSVLQRDHSFPYALGGPTVPGNAKWLCVDHNRAKSGDWHVSITPPHLLEWFELTLNRVRSRILR